MLSIILRRFLARTLTEAAKRRGARITREAIRKKDEIARKAAERINRHRKAAKDAFNQGVKTARDRSTRLKEQVKTEVKRTLQKKLGKRNYELGAMMSAIVSAALRSALKKAIKSSLAKAAKKLVGEILNELGGLLAAAFAGVKGYFAKKFHAAVDAVSAWTAEKVNEWMDYAWNSLPKPVQTAYTTIKRFFTVDDNPDIKRDELASTTKEYIEQNIHACSVECDKFVSDITTRAATIDDDPDGYVTRVQYMPATSPLQFMLYESTKAQLSGYGLGAALTPHMPVSSMMSVASSMVLQDHVEEIAKPTTGNITSIISESRTKLAEWNFEEQQWWSKRGPFHDLTGREFKDTIKGTASVAVEYAGAIGVTIAGKAMMTGFNKILSSTFAQCKAAKEMYDRTVSQIAERLVLPPQVAEMAEEIHEVIAIVEKHLDAVLDKIEDIFDVDIEKLFEDISSIFFGLAEAFTETLGLTGIKEKIEEELKNGLALVAEKMESAKAFANNVKGYICYAADFAAKTEIALGTFNVVSFVYEAYEEEKAAPASLERWYSDTYKEFDAECRAKSAERQLQLEQCATEIRRTSGDHKKSLLLIENAKKKLAKMEGDISSFWNHNLSLKIREYHTRRGIVDRWSGNWLDAFKLMQASLAATVIWSLSLLSFPYALAVSVPAMALYPSVKKMVPAPVRKHVASHSTAYTALTISLAAIAGIAYCFLGGSKK